MIRLVIIAIVILLVVIIGYMVMSGSRSDEEFVNDDDNDDDEEKADFEIEYNAESVVTSSGTTEPVNSSSRSSIITGSDARNKFESDDSVILLDVRNQNEFDEYHLEGSTLIPVDELESRLSELPDKDASIIVYCRSGIRSAAAAEILKNNGYTNVFDMQSVNNY